MDTYAQVRGVYECRKVQEADMDKYTIDDAAVREKYRTGAVDVAAAAEDSGLCETPHIADTDAWIAMDDKGREAYSATAGEIHGQTSFVATKGHYFSKIWDSIGFWIATRIGAVRAENMKNVICTTQTFASNEINERQGDEGVNDRHCPVWLKKFEGWGIQSFRKQ